jgi:hypothetical protein
MINNRGLSIIKKIQENKVLGSCLHNLESSKYTWNPDGKPTRTMLIEN